MRKIKQTPGQNACLCYGRQVCRNRPTGLSRTYPVKTNIEWGRCGFIRTAQNPEYGTAPGHHRSGGRQERSESANALERRFVAQGGTTDEHRKFPVQRFHHSKHTHYLFVFFVVNLFDIQNPQMWPRAV